jgi:hypothetical protein
MPERDEGGETRFREDQEDMAIAADADETLSPGSEPGGPEYPEEATEGPGASEPLDE